MSARQSTPGHWERYWAEREEIDDVYSNEDRIRRQLEALPLEGRWCCEVGAGSGRDSLELARRGSKVVVLDYVRTSFHVIRRQADALGLTVHPVCADAHADAVSRRDLRPRLSPGAAGALPRSRCRWCARTPG